MLFTIWHYPCYLLLWKIFFKTCFSDTKLTNRLFELCTFSAKAYTHDASSFCIFSECACKSPLSVSDNDYINNNLVCLYVFMCPLFLWCRKSQTFYWICKQLQDLRRHRLPSITHIFYMGDNFKFRLKCYKINCLLAC